MVLSAFPLLHESSSKLKFISKSKILSWVEKFGEKVEWKIDRKFCLSCYSCFCCGISYLNNLCPEKHTGINSLLSFLFWRFAYFSAKKLCHVLDFYQSHMFNCLIFRRVPVCAVVKTQISLFLFFNIYD